MGPYIFFRYFLSKFVALFGSIVIVRLLSKTDFGLLSYAENIYSYIYIFAGFGLANAILRYLVLAPDKEKRKIYFDYIIKTGNKYNCFLVIISIGVAYLCIPYTILKDNMDILISCILVIPFQNLLDCELFTERSLFHHKRYAFISAAVSIILIGGRIIGAIVDGALGVTSSRLLINASFSVVLLIVMEKYYFCNISVTKSLKKKRKKEIHIYSIQYMITNGIWTMLMLNDIFFGCLFSCA